MLPCQTASMTEGVEGLQMPTQRPKHRHSTGDTVVFRRGSTEAAQGLRCPESWCSQTLDGEEHGTMRSTDSGSDEQKDPADQRVFPAGCPEGQEDGVTKHGQQVAPDGGWGWVVLVGTVLVLALTLAFPSCLGIFFTELQTEFNTSNTETSWVPAIMTAVLHAGGPLCSVLVERFGCRATVMVGGVLSGLGMVVSALARTITELYITAIITGLGFCLSFQPSVTMMGHYFVRRRVFANALSSTGTALGLSTLPLLSNYLLSQFGWRGSFLVLGGVLFNCCVCGAVMRPLTARPGPTEPKSSAWPANPANQLREREGLKVRLRTTFSDLTAFLRHHMAFDLLVSNVRYRAYALGVTWMMLGFVVPLVFLVPYATDHGIEQDRAALLMAILGLVNIAVRPVVALLLGLPRFQGSGCFVYVFAAAVLVNGLSNAVCGASASFPVLVAYVVLFGLSMSVIGSLLFTVLMETVEMSRFPSALGLISMLESGMLLVGPPLAGILVDSTGQYSYVFYACCVSVSSAGLFLMASFYWLDRQDKKKKKPSAPAYPQKPALILAPDCQYSHIHSQAGKASDTVYVTNV
ncbi:monocarboxylate transporter 6 [Osmerus mordax]|uniref:monocarboxylate transporter 6 n=1 Tax=Osmerus mordax TaxID=8014 RepID=UPI00350EF2CA